MLRRALEAEGLLRPWLEDEPGAVAAWEAEKAEEADKAQRTEGKDNAKL